MENTFETKMDTIVSRVKYESLPELFVSSYQDYDPYDISRLFYNITGIHEKLIFNLNFKGDHDLQLEARLNKDTFGIKVKSFVSGNRICVVITFYYYISDTIHQKNVKKMFNNWSDEIYHNYQLIIKEYNDEYNDFVKNEINILKASS